MGTLPTGEYTAIKARGLTEETCRKWHYHIGKFGNETVQIADYIDPATNAVVAQKVRTKGKDFKFLGEPKQAGLFGRQLWGSGGRRVVITEGEIDAMSVSQVYEHKWPVVSIPNGSSAARKALAQNLEWLLSYDQVILCFDMDEPGRDAVQDCASLFPPGKLFTVNLPLKDANEMLVKGRTEELVRCLWNVQPYRPDGLITGLDVKEKVLSPPEEGLPYCLPALNVVTYGRRYGELVALGAGTGVGKTTLLTQQIAADLQAGHAVAVFAFEQMPEETVKRILGQICGKTFHIPRSGWTQEELEHALEEYDELLSRLHLYDHFGSCEWPVVADRIRYLRHAHEVRLFYLDHLTAFAAEAEDERKALEGIMAQMGRLVKELSCWVLFVSHLSTPDGTPHEEGGRVMSKHFKGSRSIGFWSHFMFGLERNKSADDEVERKQTVLRCLKDRYTGQADGFTLNIQYNNETGLLEEAPARSQFDQLTPDSNEF